MVCARIKKSSLKKIRVNGNVPITMPNKSLRPKSASLLCPSHNKKEGERSYIESFGGGLGLESFGGGLRVDVMVAMS